MNGAFSSMGGTLGLLIWMYIGIVTEGAEVYPHLATNFTLAAPVSFYYYAEFTPSEYTVELKYPLFVDGAPIRGVHLKVTVLGENDMNTNRLTIRQPPSLWREMKKPTVQVSRVNSSTGNAEVIQIKGDLDYATRYLTLVEEMLEREKIRVEMEYILSFSDCRPEGALCLGKYTTAGGEIREYLVFNGHPHARLDIFPWFTEEKPKVTFDMSVVRPVEYTALFTTRLLSSKPNPEEIGWMIDTFARTPKLRSSDLAVILASNLSYVETPFGGGRRPDRKTVRAYFPHGDGTLVNRTIKTTAKILTAYDKFFGDFYQVPKLDLVYLSANTEAFGWRRRGVGLTYKIEEELPVVDFPYISGTRTWSNSGDTFLSHDFDEYRETSRQINMLAEQWIPRFWRDRDDPVNPGNRIFVEGLRRFIFYIGLDLVGDDEMAKNAIILRDTHLSMVNDEVRKEFSGPVLRDDEAEVYRGQGLLRMMDATLSRATMRKALNYFVRKFQIDGHFEPKSLERDLYLAMERAAEEDNLKLPTTLFYMSLLLAPQYGLPIVRVEVLNATHLSFSARRFRKHSERFSGEDMDDFASWYIPVTYITQDSPHQVRTLWLTEAEKVVVFEHDLSNWILVNPNATGYYRTMYSEQLLQLLHAHLENEDVNNPSPIISGLSRAQLLDDYMALAREKYVRHSAVLNLTRYLRQEGHLGVWKTFIQYNDQVLGRLTPHSKYFIVEDYMEYLVDGALSEMIITQSVDERGSSKILRDELIELDCSLRGPHCASRVLPIFQKWKESPESKIAEGFECEVVAYGGEPAFDFVFERYLARIQKHEYNEGYRLVRSLTCATNRNVIQKLFNKSLHLEEFLRQEETFDDSSLKIFGTLYEGLLSSPLTHRQVIPFLTENFKRIKESLGKHSRQAMFNVLQAFTEKFGTQLEEVDKWMATIGESSFSDAFLKMRNKIEGNVCWMETTGNEILSWISRNVAEKGISLSTQA